MDDADDVSSVLGSLFVIDFLFIEKSEALAFHFDIVVLFVLFANVLTGARIISGVLFLFALLLLFLFLGAPNYTCNSQLSKLNMKKMRSPMTNHRRRQGVGQRPRRLREHGCDPWSHYKAERSVMKGNKCKAESNAPNVDVAVEGVRGHIGVRSVALVDTKGADDDLVGRNQRRDALSWKIRAKERLSLLIVSRLVAAAEEALIVGHAERGDFGMASRGSEGRELLKLGESLSQISCSG